MYKKTDKWTEDNRVNESVWLFARSKPDKTLQFMLRRFSPGLTSMHKETISVLYRPSSATAGLIVPVAGNAASHA